MCKKLMLLSCLVTLLGLSNIAFAAEQEIFRVDFSCEQDANGIKGEGWYNFVLINGCRECGEPDPYRDWQEKEDVCDTNIDVWAGRQQGGTQVFTREGGGIANSALSLADCVDNPGRIACGSMQLMFEDLDPWTSYRVYTYHAWSDGNIASISIEGADSNDIKVMPIVVDTNDDVTLLNHPNVGRIDFTTGPDVGDGNAAPVLFNFRGCTRFNAFKLCWGDPKASGPNPFNTEPDVCPNDVQLSWTPVEGLVDRSHDVYVGTDYDAVADACQDNQEGLLHFSLDQDSNEYPEDGEDFLDLELDTTHYWRVDTVNEGNIVPGRAYIWSFTTEDGNARYPCPYDYEVAWHPDANLLWTPACVATSQDVYLSTSFSDVDTLHGNAFYTTVGAGANSIGVTLETHTTYYWRVKSGGDGGDGEVWCFGTGFGGLVMYYHFNGTSGNDLLSPITDASGNGIAFTKYTAGNGSVKYAESNPVVVDSTASAHFDPCAGLYRDETSFNDPLLLAGRQYTIEAWFKVDSTYDPENEDMLLIGKGGEDRGDDDDSESWSIEVQVDDGDIKWYHSGHEDETGGHQILNEWVHIAAVYDQSLDQGRQKLYVNGGLNIHWNPDSRNSPDDHNKVYIGMIDGYDDGEFEGYERFFDGMIDELRILDIALTSCEVGFRPGDEYAGCPNPYYGQRQVDPNVVLSWGPGIGDPSHDVYFGTSYEDVLNADDDDLTGIFRGHVDVNHFPEEGNLPLELGVTYYWRVDERDNGGLFPGTIWNFETTSPIRDPNLRVWYKLDEDFGEFASDYSGRYYDGGVDMDGDGLPDWDPNDGRFGGSLGFNNDSAVECPGAVLETIGRAISVSVWLKDAYRRDGDNWVFSSRADDSNFIQAAVAEDSTPQNVLWRAGDDGKDVLRWNLGDVNPKSIEGWHLWVFVKDEAEDTMSIYFDSVQVASRDDVNDTLSGIRGRELRFGADEGDDDDEGDPDFVGRMDDARVYDKALTDDDITILFRGGDVTIAWAPEPHDGAAEAQLDTDLAWMPGDDVADTNGHQVYFGTNWQEVQDANSTSHPNVEYSHQDACSYDPCGLLELGQTYYWRVDEVNEANVVWTGNVWRFTVAEFITIDDMEDYTEGSGSAHPIEDGWTQGWDEPPPYSGAYIGLGLISGLRPVRGDQSMEYLYDNSTGTYYSETGTKSLDPNDWTSGGVEMLTLWLHGLADNDANETEQLYVAVEDDDGNYAEVRYGDNGEDMNDIRLEDWTVWYIPLNMFESNNPDLVMTAIKTFYIGFGDSDSLADGGSGVAYFDDIRLSRPTCVLWERTLEFAKLDLDDDCAIGFGDVKVMAGEWLTGDVNLGQVTNPSDTNLVGWWEFDEGTGSDAYDSSSKVHDGTIETIDTNVWWVAGVNDTNALDFDGGRVRVLDHEDLRPLHQVSVSAWIKYWDQQNNGRVVAKGADDKETYQLEVDGDDDLKFSVRDGNDYDEGDDEYQNYGAESDDDALDRDEWVHVAGTYDGNSLKAYVNGELVAENNDANSNVILFLAQDTNDLAIGNKPGGEDDPFKGIIDDVRVYDRGLTAAEIGYLATDGTGIVALESIADLHKDPPGQGAINFKDLAKLGAAWFDEELYP